MKLAYKYSRTLPSITTEFAKVRSAIGYRKRLSRYLTLPAFTVSTTWLGASYCVRKFNYTASGNFSITKLPVKPASANFCPCLWWMDNGTVYRFKLWENSGEILYVPLYDNRKLPANFSVEIWSCSGEVDATLITDFILYSSILDEPTLFCCETDGAALSTTILTCSDNTMELDGVTWSGLDGDYWTFDTCGFGTFVDVPSPIGLFINAIGLDTEEAFGLHTIEAAVSPMLYPNLICWWKADSLSLNDGDQVGAGGASDWTDSSGQGHTAYQATAAYRPLYKTNIVGAMPAVLFDGVNDFLWYNQFTIPPGTKITIIAVYKHTLASNDGVLLGTTVNYQVRSNRNNANTISWYNGVLDMISEVLVTPTTDLRMATWRQNGTGVQSVHFRENKTARGTINSAWLDFLFSIMGKASWGGMLQGYICEICIWLDTYLEDAEVDYLYDAYFKPKWTALP